MPRFRRRRLDADLITDLGAALSGSSSSQWADSLHRDVLATGRGADCGLVLTRSHLAVRRVWAPGDAITPSPTIEPPEHQPTSWRWWPWQQVQGGSWTGETRRLAVRLLEDDEFQLTLDEPGEVPAVFAERVQSSILVEERMRVPGGEVVVSGRRAPVSAAHDGRRSPVVWHALAVGDVDLRRPDVAARVLAATNRLAADYDIQ